MQRMFVIVAAAVALSAPAAVAQVASPELAPGMPRFNSVQYLGMNSVTFTPSNPAAQQWSPSSHIGIGQVTGEQDFPPFGIGDIEGDFYGLRWVGSWLSFGAESLAFDIKNNPFNMLSVELTGVSLAGAPWEWISLGVSKDDTHLESPTFSRDLSGTSVGLSLRLFDVLYIGASSLDETFENDPGGAPGDTGDRAGTAMGIALSGGDENRWRIEYSIIENEDFIGDDGLVAGGGFDRVQTQAEVILYNVLLAYSSHESESPPPGNPIVMTGSTYSIGFVPASGLTLAYRHEEGELKAGVTKISDEVDSVAIGWNW